MSASFVLLEILDPIVNAFLWSIRDILSGKRRRGPIHLTIRGPYDGDAPKPLLDSWQSALKYDVLRIAGVGRFSNNDDEVVFFKVDSPHLRSVWWKPTFPIQKFGFEPHISVYRGHDADLADLVAQFLDKERIELLCAEHRLIWHQSGQPNLFTIRTPPVGALDDLHGSHAVDATVLDRLQELTDEYRQQRRLQEIPTE